MKKYLFGVFAIALAVGFSAFTQPAKMVNVRFKIQVDPTSALAVQEKSNWQLYTGSNCTGTDFKACTIEVDPQYVTMDNQLSDDVIIVAAGSSTAYRVDLSSSTNVAAEFNKSAIE
jgi:hypothetical protein